jgi:CBS domain-containing protein
MTMLVKDIMMREVATVGPHVPLATAARRMRDREVGCLPVVEDERLVGMLTDRDLVVRGVADALDPVYSVVREAMSAGAIACSVDDAVDQAEDLMVAHRIKRLPVLDRRKRLVGLVSLADLAARVRRSGAHPGTLHRRLTNGPGHLRDVEIGKA